MSSLKSRLFAALVAISNLAAAGAAAEGTDDALGTYSGAFGPNTIKLRIEKIEGKTATGYSEVGKNRRPFSGSVTEAGGSPRFELREPGDNPEDGVFRFQYSPEQQTIAGTWTPNNKKIAEVRFRLAKSGKSGVDPRGAASGQPGGASAASGHTDGTLDRIEARGSHNYFVLRDKEGREQAFASLGQDMTQLSYLGAPESHRGTPMRIHWKTDTVPGSGEKVRSIVMISEGPSKMYLPPQGSAEHKAIIEAARASFERRYNKRVTLEGSVQVENDWAGFSGTAKVPGDKRPGAIWVVILRGSGTKWNVVATSDGDPKAPKRNEGDDSRPHWDELKRLRKEYPNAPVSILALFDYP